MKKETETKKIVKQKFEKFNHNNFKTIEVLFLLLVTAVVSGILGYLISNKNATSDDKYVNEIIKNYNHIVNDYYDDIDKDAIVDGAIDGMLKTLDDDYSQLISDEHNSLYTSLEGSYDGIGIEIVNDNDNNVIVVGVISDSPAKKAGINVGDIIKKIDDEEFLNRDITEVTKYIRDNNKKNYEITILRDEEEIKINVEKENITIKSIASDLYEKENHKIGYIYISIFSSNTASQFEEALNELEEQGIDALIIDVRYNSGGYLSTVTSILSKLVDNSHVIYQTEKNKEIEKTKSSGTITKSYPIVILQNKSSASASELLSSSLKENVNAIIVGETSYGKGTVQEIVDLSNGEQYKFTTKKWLTPNGNWINKKGVEPDIKVKLADEYYKDPTDENDNQLQAAIDAIVK